MFRKEISLEEGDKLQIQWSKGYSSLEIFQGQQSIAQFSDLPALKLGHQISMPDGRKLTVILANHGLEIWQNNVDRMTGLKSGSADLFSRAVSWLLGFGGLQAAFGVFLGIFLMRDESMKFLAIGIIISGGLFMSLGFWANKSKSVLPLYIGSGYAALNLLLTLLAGQIGGVFLSGLIAWTLYKGAQAGPLDKNEPAFFDENGPLDANL